MLNVIYAKSHIQNLYAECRYAECRYAECRIFPYGVQSCGLTHK
jgi:hypothetical protein